MEYMKDIPDNHYDLSIVDVPYGINQGGGKNHTRTKPFGSRKDSKNTRGTFIEAKN